MDALVVLQLGLGLILITLNARNAKYMYDWWAKSHEYGRPERSWLLRALASASAVTTTGILYFMEITLISVLLGPQPQLRPVSTLVLIILLLQFWRIGQEFRIRERALFQRARKELLDSKEG